MFVDTLSFELKVEDKYNFDLDTINVYVMDIPEPLVVITSSSSAQENIGAAKISLGVSAKSGKKPLFMHLLEIAQHWEMVKIIQTLMRQFLFQLENQELHFH